MRPQSTASSTASRKHRPSSSSADVFFNPFSLANDKKEPFKQRPISAKSVTLVKSQSVRSNLDKYRIEMVTRPLVFFSTTSDILYPLHTYVYIDHVEANKIFDRGKNR